MKTNMKLNLLTALTLVVLPAVAMAAPTMQHVATFTPARQVNVGHPYVQYPPIAIVSRYAG